MTRKIKDDLVWIVRCNSKRDYEVSYPGSCKFWRCSYHVNTKNFVITCTWSIKLILLCNLFFIDVILLLSVWVVLYLIEIYWFSKRLWQLRYASDDSNHLLDTLNFKNFRMSFSFLHNCRNSKSNKAFLYLKSNFSNSKLS